MKVREDSHVGLWHGSGEQAVLAVRGVLSTVQRGSRRGGMVGGRANASRVGGLTTRLTHADALDGSTREHELRNGFGL